MTSTITWMVALITFGLVILTWEIFEKNEVNFYINNKKRIDIANTMLGIICMVIMIITLL